MEDLEATANKVKSKIRSYFSQLIATMKSRKEYLISEVDKIVSRYTKKRENSRKKIQDLEKLMKHYEGLSSSKVRDLNDEILSRVKREILSEIEDEKKTPFTIKFEWKPKDLTKAGEFGALKYSSIDPVCDIVGDISRTQHHHNHKKQQKQQQQGRPFILSEQLTQQLMEYTDIGPIPREILLNANILYQTQHYFLVRSNWNTIIQGCYWCLSDCSNNFATIFCCRECFFLFNEWSFRKLQGTRAVHCCKYLSCPNSVAATSPCCDKHSRKYSSEFNKLEHLLRTSKFILGPSWYHNGGLTTVDFYNRDEPFYEFTNFYPCPSLKINDVIFPTSEHYFISQKFVDTTYPAHTSDDNPPSETFNFSRSNSIEKWTRPDWSTVKDDVMYKVLKEKFIQNPDLGFLLKSTCNAHLFEHTNVDKYWGDGGDTRTGQNKLGLLLMKVRSELQAGSVYYPDTLSHYTYEELYNLVSSIPPLVTEANSQSIQQSEVSFNLGDVKEDQNNFTQHLISESDLVSDEVQSAPIHTFCLHGTFGKSSTNDLSDSLRPPPFNPDFSRSTYVLTETLRDRTDNSESMDVIFPESV